MAFISWSSEFNNSQFKKYMYHTSLHCHIMPFTMLYLYLMGFTAYWNFEIKSKSESIILASMQWTDT